MRERPAHFEHDEYNLHLARISIGRALVRFNCKLGWVMASRDVPSGRCPPSWGAHFSEAELETSVSLFTSSNAMQGRFIVFSLALATAFMGFAQIAQANVVTSALGAAAAMLFRVCALGARRPIHSATTTGDCSAPGYGFAHKAVVPSRQVFASLNCQRRHFGASVVCRVGLDHSLPAYRRSPLASRCSKNAE